MTLTIRTGVLAVAALTASTSLAGHADAATLTLTTGDTLVGTVTDLQEGVYVVEHPVLGTLWIPQDRVSSIVPEADESIPGGETPAQASGSEASEPEGEPDVVTTVPTSTTPTTEDVEELPEVRPGLFGTGFMRGWTRSISLAVNGAEGNTEELNVTAGFTAGFEDDFDRWALESAYTLGTNNGDRTDHDFYASIQKDWLLPDSKWFYFAQGRYDWDEFEDWEHRVAAGGGIGYEFLDRDDLWLRGRAGLGLSKEFGSEDEDIVPEAILGVTFGWKPADNQEVTFANTLYPALDEFFKYRNITSAAWKIAINQDYGLSLKLGLENEYESETGDDIEHNDLKYYAAIVYDF